MPIHKNIFGELISVQIHAAHVSAPARIQENIPGELLCIGFVPGQPGGTKARFPRSRFPTPNSRDTFCPPPLSRCPTLYRNRSVGMLAENLTLHQRIAKGAGGKGPRQKSETGRIRFRGVRFQTPNSVSFLGLTEFRGANSVSSFQPIICV